MSYDTITTLTIWDELDCSTTEMHEDELGENADLTSDCTDGELVERLRAIHADEDDGWRVDHITRRPQVAFVEWRSDRDHLAITTVIWG